MPLSDLALTAALRFTLTKDVSGWPPIVQGENEVTANLSDVDLSEWDQVYANRFLLDFYYGSNVNNELTIDLFDFDNLATEAVTFSKVYGIIVQIEPEDPSLTDCVVEITPGDTNGLQWPVIADMTVKTGQTFLHVDSPGAGGFPVDATHRSIKFFNSGDDRCYVRVAILGGT